MDLIWTLVVILLILWVLGFSLGAVGGLMLMSTDLMG